MSILVIGCRLNRVVLAVIVKNEDFGYSVPGARCYARQNTADGSAGVEGYNEDPDLGKVA